MVRPTCQRNYGRKCWNRIILMKMICLKGIRLDLKRYNAVCHLVTAADGAEKFYNLSHEARHESA